MYSSVSRARRAPPRMKWRLCVPTRTFSSTVIVEKSSTFWNVRAMPRCTTRYVGVRSSDFPSNTSSPDCGLYSRVITLKSVVFPAPFGPISPTISPGSASIETSSSATIPPNCRVTCSTVSKGATREP